MLPFLLVLREASMLGSSAQQKHVMEVLRLACRPWLTRGNSHLLPSHAALSNSHSMTSTHDAHELQVTLPAAEYFKMSRVLTIWSSRGLPEALCPCVNLLSAHIACLCVWVTTKTPINPIVTPKAVGKPAGACPCTCGDTLRPWCQPPTFSIHHLTTAIRGGWYAGQALAVEHPQARGAYPWQLRL
jgi:hypothetical protein